MASRDRCPRCGALVLPEENFCPQCGVKLTLDGAAEPRQEYVPETAAPAGSLEPEAAEPLWQPGTRPATIGQLRAFCDFNEMPLEKMRFFVGVDYRQARAFGIYQEGDQFIVYKNKDDGSRAVRYHGPDEAHAVGELYDKLLDECHKRDIWPDGKPEDWDARRKKQRRRRLIAVAVVVALFLGFAVFAIRDSNRRHAHDGYYRFDDTGTFYLYGDIWYYYDDYYDWVEFQELGYADEYADYYLGDDYEDAWDVSDFRQSDAWEDIQAQSHTSSSDYSSWDSGGTDWSSDW